MKNPNENRDRYLRDNPAIRLGNLASELLRLSNWIDLQRSDEAVVGLMRRIAWLIEWNTESATAELADMQREICRWRRAWPTGVEPRSVASHARMMSARVLMSSKLME